MTTIASSDPAAIVETLAREGVVKLDGFLSADAIAGVRRELEAARAARDDSAGSPSQRGPTIFPTSMMRHGRLGEISEISRVMLSPVLDAVRAEKIGWSSYVTDILGIESLPAHRIITQWHVDGTMGCVAHPGDARIKLFFYLNDVARENGAFSYVPRTHLVLDAVHRAMNRHEIEPENIRDLSELRTLFAHTPPRLDGELQRVADEMFGAIESDTAPCGPYSLEGAAGTLIIFDERGMHRGGDIAAGRRSILRISLKQETLDGTSALFRAVARKLARIVLPRRYAKLM